MGSAGSSSMGGAPMLSDTVRTVGAGCEQDADCGEGFFCITEAMNGFFVGEGGPPGGYCSRLCGGNEDCTAVDELSGCFVGNPDGQGFCTAVCQPGPSTAAAPALKCNGRAGDAPRVQACVELPGQSTLGTCLPRCLSDADCAGGRFCDLAVGGLCMDAPREGGDFGDPCAEDGDCRGGICVELLAGGSVCSAFCRFNTLAGCGFEEDAELRGAACLESVALNAGAGDLGICRELCDEPTDCVQEGFVCDPFGADLSTTLGRVGSCLPPDAQ